MEVLCRLDKDIEQSFWWYSDKHLHKEINKSLSLCLDKDSAGQKQENDQKRKKLWTNLLCLGTQGKGRKSPSKACDFWRDLVIHYLPLYSIHSKFETQTKEDISQSLLSLSFKFLQSKRRINDKESDMIHYSEKSSYIKWLWAGKQHGNQ